MPQPSKCLRPSWMGLWAKGVPAHGKRIVTTWSLKSLPPQAILWLFYFFELCIWQVLKARFSIRPFLATCTNLTSRCMGFRCWGWLLMPNFNYKGTFTEIQLTIHNIAQQLRSKQRITCWDQSSSKPSSNSCKLCCGIWGGTVCLYLPQESLEWDASLTSRDTQFTAKVSLKSSLPKAFSHITEEKRREYFEMQCRNPIHLLSTNQPIIVKLFL